MLHISSAWYSFARVPKLLTGKTVPMLGLRSLASRAKKASFQGGQVFNFVKRESTGGFKINGFISSALLKAGVEKMVFKFGSVKGEDRRALKAAIRSSLRYLSVYGVPKEGEIKVIDVSWTLGADDYGFGNPIEHIGSATVMRGENEREALVVFDYSTKESTI